MKELEEVVDAYNEAWNRQDLDAICAAHAPGMVFENHNAGERAEGEAVRAHIASIFANWPDLRFAERSRYTGDDFVVQEWTATARRIPTVRSSRGTASTSSRSRTTRSCARTSTRTRPAAFPSSSPNRGSA